ncbi:hypothetical protein ABVT39_017139 [Epinephelus coioides]
MSSSKTQRPAGAVRLCPSCQIGYIMPSDLHSRCETCLGPEHAGIALTTGAACAFCTSLPVEELQRRADAFAVLMPDGDGDDSWADHASFTVEEAVQFFDRSSPGGVHGAGHRSDDTAPSIAAPPPGSPLSPLGDLEIDDDVDERRAPLARPSPTSPQPAGHLPAKALLQDLPGIIRWAADLKSVPVPADPPAPVHSVLGGDIYAPEPAPKHFPVRPCVTELQPFIDAAFSEPGKLKVPVARYDPFTRVNRDTEHGFPAVPQLEESLATILLLTATFFGRRKPTPPSPRDQVTARLSDRAHQCAAQSVAAVNNVALLGSAVSAVATQPGALPPKMATEIGKAMSAILTLSTATTVAQACIMAWQTMLQRNMWLHMSQLPAQIRGELLGGPISSDGASQHPPAECV